MSKKTAAITASILLIFIFGLGILNIALPARAFSPMENRYLAQMPRLTVESLLSGELMRDLDAYLTDQFFGRDSWVGVKYLLQRSLLKTENNGVYFGKNGMLMQSFPRPDGKRLQANLDAVSALAQLSGVPVYFTLAPTSAHVYAGSLPANAPTYNQQLLLDMCVRLPQYFDISQALIDNSGEYIYYSTDHHWTTYGAYLAYRVIAQEMGLRPIDLPEEKNSLEGFYGTTLSQGGVRFFPADRIDYYTFPNLAAFDSKGESITINNPDFFDVKDKYSLFLSGNHPLVVVKNSANPQGGKLVLVRDSYSDCLLPFLAQHFSEVHVIDTRYYQSSVAGYCSDIGAGSVLALFQTATFAAEASLFFMGRPA